MVSLCDPPVCARVCGERERDSRHTACVESTDAMNFLIAVRGAIVHVNEFVVISFSILSLTKNNFGARTFLITYKRARALAPAIASVEAFL